MIVREGTDRSDLALLDLQAERPPLDGAGAAASEVGSFWSEVKRAGAEVRQWPLTARLLALALVALYVPVVFAVAKIWVTEDNYAHGIFILPLCIVLLWLARDELRQARKRPVAWGLVALGVGLLMQLAGYLLSFNFLAMISIIPVLAGAILALHGRDLWRVSRFAVLYLFFAAPLPSALLLPTSAYLQRVSSTGAVVVMRCAGFTIAQAGNIIQVPGTSLEVADVCSGLKKLVAMIAFAVLYGYIFRTNAGRRVVLVLAAIPIAVIANVARIGGLIAVASIGGVKALHVAHDWAELFVLVVAFFLFVSFGKLIGCTTLRFSPPPRS